MAASKARVRAATALRGACAGAGMIAIIGWIGEIAMGKEAMGLGDVTLMAFVGAALGPQRAIITVFLGAVLGMVGWVAIITGVLLGIVCVAVVALLYAPALMARTNGKTLGRMVTDIRVVRADGRPITFGFAMIREVAVKTLLVGVASSVTGGIAYLVDVLWPLWDEENRALHDFVVNTRTVID